FRADARRNALRILLGRVGIAARGAEKAAAGKRDSQRGLARSRPGEEPSRRVGVDRVYTVAGRAERPLPASAGLRPQDTRAAARCRARTPPLSLRAPRGNTRR